MQTLAQERGLIPSGHPHVSEPLIDQAGFALELWKDWPLLASQVEAYQGAVREATLADRAEGASIFSGRATVVDRVLWVSVTATGPGQAGDVDWALAEEHFRELWADVHLRAHSMLR